LSSSGRSSRAFFDTNILVYSDDPREPAKQNRAFDLVAEHMRRRTGVVSIQVLQEYFVSARKKLKLDPEIARERVKAYAMFHVAEPKVNDILAAIDLHRLYNLSLWDALIFRSAKQAGCSVLLSEDMQHEQVIDGIRIVNPFI
jgi:predicted nucleic acid-binding protein